MMSIICAFIFFLGCVIWVPLTIKFYCPANSYKNENVNMTGINVISREVNSCSKTDVNTFCWNPRGDYHSDYETFQNGSEIIKVPICKTKMYDCMIDFYYNDSCASYNVINNHLSNNIITVFTGNGSCYTKNLFNCTAIYKKIYIAHKYSYDCTAYFAIPKIGNWEVIWSDYRPSAGLPLSLIILLFVSCGIFILTFFLFLGYQ